MNEKREYYRVNQKALLDYQVITPEDLQNRRPEDFFQENSNINLANKIKRLKEDSNSLLQKLNQQNKLLGEYLQNLESRFESLLEYVVSNDGDNIGADQAAKDIDLGEGGFSFTSSKPIYKGRLLVVSMTFLPDCASLSAFAKVVRHDALSDNQHRQAVNFLDLTLDQSQLIAKAVMKTQILNRKQQKLQEKHL